MFVAGTCILGCGTNSVPSPEPTEDPAGTVDPSADPDEDHLTNAEEGAAGTDAQNPDTDGDGYLDGDEVLEGTDPLDIASVIYLGGWPYQRDKDDIVDPGFDASPMIGSTVPRFLGYDQFGQLVDLYDYSFHGRPVVIDLSSIWCEACKDMALWLEGKPSNLDAEPELDEIVERVAAGEIYWITVIVEDAAGNPAGAPHAVAWAEAFDNDRVAVLADNDRQFNDYLFPGGLPFIQVLAEDMTLFDYDRFDYKAGLTKLLESE